MIKQNQINHIVVTPVIAHGGEPDSTKIKGYDFIPLLYANVFLCAKKKSGKTNVIYNLIDNTVGPETEVYIYASTLHKDPTYKALMKLLKKRNITFESHTSFINSKTKDNYLEDVIHGNDTSGDDDANDDVQQLQPGQRQRPEKLTSHVRSRKPPKPPTKGLPTTSIHRQFLHNVTLSQQSRLSKGPLFTAPAEPADFDNEKNYNRAGAGAGGGNSEGGKRVIAPDKIFVFDDLGADLRHPCINQLLKTNRHERSKVIISSQYITDLQPQAIKQLDFCILFKAFGEEKLLKIHELFDLSTPWNYFYAMYRLATSAPYSFLFVDVRKEQFRKNFNIALDIGPHHTNDDNDDDDDDGDERVATSSKRQRMSKQGK